MLHIGREPSPAMQPHLHILPAMGPRGGFSLIEATIAMTVLVGALLLTVGQFQNIRTVQTEAQQRLLVDHLLTSLVERINGAQSSDLGTVNAKWSAPRFELAAITSCPPMSEITADPLGVDASYKDNNNLKSLGLITGTTNAQSLKVYVEYYRAVNYRDGSGTIDNSQEGVLESAFTTATNFKSNIYITPGMPEQGLLAKYRLAPSWQTQANQVGATPSSLVGPDDPLLIRIIATWGPPDMNGRPTYRREIFTARSP